MSADEKHDDFLTVDEVAHILKKKERTIREWCYSKYIPHYKVGGTLLFRYEDLMKWIRSKCRVDSAQPYSDKHHYKKADQTHPPKLKI